MVGAGPAGLTAALELTRHGISPRVLERDGLPGGLARTEAYRGYRFDMGGHRFFTKVPEIADLWKDILGDDFRKRPRLSRIYYKGRFFQYPLQVQDTLMKLGLVEAARILASYGWAQLLPRRPETSFEDWVSNRFGRRLFRTFFKSYTEKVWGVSCAELRAEWAAQRIKDLSVGSLLRQVLLSQGRRSTSLIEEFHYPRLGPGMMWERTAERVVEAGGSVEFGLEVEALAHEEGRIRSVRLRDAAGRRVTAAGTDFILSMPLSDFISRLSPPPEPSVLAAARGLRYRDFLTVGLVVRRARLFPDNWIYVHEPGVAVARIQNYSNWSEDMSPDPSRTSLGLEYFCNEGDSLWNRTDEDLVRMARAELESIGLARAEDVEDGCVFRIGKAYPLYDVECAGHVATLRAFLAGFSNCQLVGRNGLHRYNNQDHSMVTGLLAVRNALFGAGHDLWSVNTDEEYHETRSGRA